MQLDILQIKGLAVLAVLATLPNVSAAPMRGNGQHRNGPRGNSHPDTTPVGDSMAALVRRSAIPGDSRTDSVTPTTTSSAIAGIDTPKMIDDFIALVQPPENPEAASDGIDPRVATVESLMSNILNSGGKRKRSIYTEEEADLDSLRMVHAITDLTAAIDQLPPGSNPMIRVKKRDLIALQERDFMAEVVKIFDLVKTDGMRKFKQWMEKIDVKEIIMWLTTADIFKDITETLINGLLDNTALGGMVEKLADCKETPLRKVGEDTSNIPQNGTDEDQAAAAEESKSEGEKQKAENRTEGNKAEGNQANGNQANGNQANGNQANGNKSVNKVTSATNKTAPTPAKQSATPTPAPQKPKKPTKPDTTADDEGSEGLDDDTGSEGMDDDSEGMDDGADTADVDDDENSEGMDDDSEGIDDGADTGDVNDDENSEGIDDDDSEGIDDDDSEGLDDDNDSADVDDDENSEGLDDDADSADVDDGEEVEPTPVRKPKTTKRVSKVKTSTKAKPTSDDIEIFRMSYGNQKRDDPPAPAPASMKMTNTASASRVTVTAAPALPHDYRPYDPATFDDLDDDDEVDVTAGNVLGWFKDVGKKIKEGGEKAVETVRKGGEKAVETVTEGGQKAVEKVKEEGGKAVETVKNEGEKAVHKVESVAHVAGSAITSVAITAGNKIKETALKTANEVKKEIKELVKDGERLFNEAIDELKKLANYVKKWFFQKTLGLAFKSLLQGQAEEKKKQKRAEVADEGGDEGSDEESGTGEEATGDSAADTAIQMGVGLVTRGGVMAFTRFMPFRMFTSIVLGIMSSKLGQSLLQALQCKAQRTDLDWLKDGLQYLTGMEADPNAKKQTRDLHMEYDVRDIKVADPNAWLIEASTRGIEPTAKLNFL